MDRRIFPRYPLELPAEFRKSRVQVADPIPCQMLDYSFGGLMIEVERREGESLKVGQQGIVSFQHNDLATGSVTYQVSIRVMRSKEGIIGACFEPSPIPAVRLALQAAASLAARQVSRPSGPPGRRLSAEKAGELLKETWAAMQPELHMLIQTMPAQIHPQLMAAARQLLDPQDKKIFLDSLGDLSLTWNEVVQKWEASLQEYLQRAAGLQGRSAFSGIPDAAAAEMELSILSELEFESSLAIQTHAAAALRRHRETIRQLNVNLNSALGCSYSEHDSPLGPAFLMGAFHETAQHLYPDQRLVRVYLDLFNEAVLEHLGDVLNAVRKVFDQWNLVAPDDLADRRARKRTEATVSENVQQHLTRGSTSAHTEPAAVAPRRQSTPVARPKTPPRRSAQSAAAGVGRLLNLLLTPPVGEPVRASRDAGAGAPISHEMLVDSLGKLEFGTPRAGDARLPFQEWLRKTLHRVTPESAPVEFSDEQQRVIRVVEELFDSIREHALMPEQTLDWLSKLQVPILRLVLQDPQFLAQRDHPARQVLNQLARIGGDSEILGSLRQVIDNYVDRILQSHHEGPWVFIEVLQGLNTIVERRREAFLSNVRRIADAQEGTRLLLDMRIVVSSDLRARLGRKNLMIAVHTLIERCWRDLLVMTALREGVTSATYKGYMGILEVLQFWLTPPKPRIFQPLARRLQRENAERLLEDLAAGLDFASADPFFVANQLETMQHLLIGDVDKVPLELLAPAALDSALWPESCEIPTDPDRLAALELQDRGIVRQLQAAEIGAVLFLHKGTPKIRRARLAWKAADLSRLVLTDDRGGDVREYRLEEFFTFCHQSNVEILGEDADSLLDIGLLEAVQKAVEFEVSASSRDELTGAACRREFLRQVEQCVAGANDSAGATGYVLVVNVDWFDLLNTKVGHAAGDRYLCHVADLLRSVVESAGLVGRIAGDEFGVLLPHISRDDAWELAEKIRTLAATSSVNHDGATLAQTVTVGGAPLVYADDYAGTPLEVAVTACRGAKAAGRNATRFYDDADVRLREAVQVKKLAVQVQELVSGGQLSLRFQPIAPIDPLDPHHHHEALLLLHDEDGNQVSPQQFILAAESYGHAQLVDRWVVRHAMSWLSDHPEMLTHLGSLAINLSGASINDPDFLQFLLKEIDNLRIPPESFSFEVTETAAVSNLEQAREFLHQVRAAGCRVALDDFGAGMASYAYLRSMPVDYIKIDGAFIREIATTPADLAVVRSINEVAHFLRIKTIAEYVENEEILDILRDLGVDYAQGYEIGRPVPMERFAADIQRETNASQSDRGADE